MGGNDVKRKTQHHWASKCKVDFAKDFEQKGIPLETTEEEQCRKELHDLESFFRMDDAQVRKSVREVLTFTAIAFSEVGNRARQAGRGEEAVSLARLTKPWTPQSALPQDAALLDGRRVAPVDAILSGPMEVPAVPEIPAEFAVPGTGPGSDRTPSAPSTARRPPLTDRPSARNSPGAGSRGHRKQPVIAAAGIGGSPREVTTASHQDSVTDGGLHQSSMRSNNWLMSSAEDMLATIGSLGSDVAGKQRREAQLRIHRPITAGELADACTPVLITVPPIFQRTSDRPQESHYEYFTRKIPCESPEHRKVMWWRTETTRKVYNYPMNSSVSPDGRPKSQGSARLQQRPNSGGEDAQLSSRPVTSRPGSRRLVPLK